MRPIEAKEEEKFKSDSPFLDRRGNGSGYFPTTCSRHRLAPCYDPVFLFCYVTCIGWVRKNSFQCLPLLLMCPQHRGHSGNLRDVGG